MSERARFVRHEALPGAAQSKRPVVVYVIAVDGRELRKRFSEFDALRARLIAAGCPGARAARLPSKIKKSVARRSGALPAFLNELLRAVGGGLEAEPSAAPLRDFLGLGAGSAEPEPELPEPELPEPEPEPQPQPQPWQQPSALLPDRGSRRT